MGNETDQVKEAKRLIAAMGGKDAAIKATEQIIRVMIQYPESKFYVEVLQQIENYNEVKNEQY